MKFDPDKIYWQKIIFSIFGGLFIGFLIVYTLLSPFNAYATSFTFPETYYVPFGFSTAINPLDSTDYYFGNVLSQSNSGSATQNQYLDIPYQGTITKAIIKCIATNSPSTTNITLKINNNGTTTIGTFAFSSTIGGAEFSGLNITAYDWSSGYQNTMLISTPAWPTNPTSMTCRGALIIDVSATQTINEEDNTCHISAGTGISVSTCTITNSNPEDGLDHLPTQTGNSGKFLTTNGTTSSWGTPTDTGCTAYSCLTGLPSLFSGAFSDLTGKPTTLSGYGITDAVPSSRTLTIDTIGYDLSANRSWTTTGGGGGCTDFSCLTGTDNIIQLDSTSQYALTILFLFILFCLISWIIIGIVKTLL